MSSIPANFPVGHTIADPDDTFEVGLGPFYTPDNDTDHSVMFVAEARHVNAHNVVHGALLMTLADLAICYTARQGYPGESALTVSMNADFVDGGLLGEFIVAQAEVMESAERAGIEGRTIERAKTALKIESHKEGSQWFWALPTTDGGGVNAAEGNPWGTT